MRLHCAGAVVAHDEHERALELPPRAEPVAQAAHHRVHLQQGPPDRLRVGMGLVGIAVHGRELREDEPRRSVHCPQQMTGDRVVGGLMPLGVVREGAPELALSA